MGKFDGVLLASDFDNTLIYTEEALRSGVAVPELSPENRAALEYFMAEGGREICHRHRPGAGGLHQIRGSGAHERAGHCVQRRGPV